MRPIILTLCSLLVFPALAASGSGLLVGLRDSDNHYRTIWIVSEGGAPAVVASVKGLVIPRTDGLWRMDVERVSCGDMGQYSVDELRVGPLDSGGGAGPIQDCETMAKASCAEDYPFGGSLTLDRWISYAGPTHFAEAFRSVESCGVYPYPMGEMRYSVHAIHHPEQEVPLERAFLVDSRDALQSAAREALVCGTDDLDCIDSRDRYRLFPAYGWGIVRGASQWSVVAALVPPAAPDRAIPSPVVTEFPAPAAIVGGLDPGGSATMTEAPPGGDRSLSPEGDMLVVRSERLAVYRVVDGAVGLPPTEVSVSPDEQIVMIEWAAGPEVLRWGDVLEELPSGVPVSSFDAW